MGACVWGGRCVRACVCFGAQVYVCVWGGGLPSMLTESWRGGAGMCVWGGRAGQEWGMGLGVHRGTTMLVHHRQASMLTMADYRGEGGGQQ